MLIKNIKNNTMVFGTVKNAVEIKTGWKNALRIASTLKVAKSFYYKYEGVLLKVNAETDTKKIYIQKKIEGKNVFKPLTPFDYVEIFGGKITYTKQNNKVIAIEILPGKKTDLAIAKTLSYVLEKRISTASGKLNITHKIKVPSNVKNRFTDHERFILDNTESRSGKPIFKFAWHPESGELVYDVEPVMHKQMIYYGKHPFHEYCRGIYMKNSEEVLLRPYWNYTVSGDDWDKKLSLKVQEACKKALQLRGGRAIKYTFDVSNKSLTEKYGGRW